MVPNVAGSNPVDRPYVPPIEALVFGLVQGFTEFLPVSSSGHLALAEHFLGFKNLHQLVFFDLVCHLGTLLSIAVIFKQAIREALNSRSQLWAIFLGMLPLVPLVLFVKPLKALFDRLDLIGYFFLMTALLLWLGQRYGSTRPQARRLDPLYIGLFQALAILPGLSAQAHNMRSKTARMAA